MSRFSPLKTYVPWYLVANPRSSDTHRSCHGNVATLAFERKKRARNYDDIHSSLLCQEQQFLEFWALQPTMIPKASSPSIAARQRRSTFKKTKWDKKGFSCLYISIVVKKKIYLASGCDSPVCLDASILMFNWESRASFTFTNPHNLAWIPASPP